MSPLFLSIHQRISFDKLATLYILEVVRLL